MLSQMQTFQAKTGKKLRAKVQCKENHNMTLKFLKSPSYKESHLKKVVAAMRRTTLTMTMRVNGIHVLVSLATRVSNQIVVVQMFRILLMPLGRLIPLMALLKQSLEKKTKFMIQTVVGLQKTAGNTQIFT